MNEPDHACPKCGRPMATRGALCGPCQVAQSRATEPRGRLLLATVLLAATGCTTLQRDKATVYTEEGLRAAETAWDADYHARADECDSKHEPETPAMEACFGEWYDADEVVADVVQVSVAALRVYWTARASGEKDVSFTETMGQIVTAVEGLPPIAKKYFERVKGMKK